MRTTASFELFPDAPDDRELARARWLGREGKVAEAVAAYRAAWTNNPDSRAPWAEAFELLRSTNRALEALALAHEARETAGESAFTLALAGAALIELERYREALTALDRAVDYDPDLALVWHELGYAAYKLGEPTRALMALDRAFALEPHTETLMLRGRILLQAGRYRAAEVAFEAANQTATHDEQRHSATSMIRSVHRHILLGGRKPSALTAGNRFFAETGAVVLASAPGASTHDDLIRAFATLAADLGWQFGQLVVAGDTAPFRWLGRALRLSIDPPDQLVADRIPIVATTIADEHVASDWTKATEVTRAARTGVVLVLEQPLGTPAGADVVGRPVGAQGGCDPALAVVQAQHPDARLAGRRLTQPMGQSAETA